jgi:SAM-dependent methyltransferase
VLAALTTPRRADDVAAELGLDAAMLTAVLEYCAERTELVTRSGRRFATRQYDDAARFVLDLYAGAYRPNAVSLETLLHRPERARGTVDRARHARAFGLAPTGPEQVPAALLGQLGVRYVLELGCGLGGLLRTMALADGQFQGWGIDANSATCRFARAAMREAGVAGRVRIAHGDGLHPVLHIPQRTIAAIEAVVARDFTNELFGRASVAATSWLRQLRHDFPGRLLLICDYYGRLGHRRVHGSRETLLHDYAQVISGQGVPPPTRRAWTEMYHDAGVRPLHIMEDRSTTRFLHLLQL